MEEFRDHEITLQGGFALAFYNGQIEASLRGSAALERAAHGGSEPGSTAEQAAPVHAEQSRVHAGNGSRWKSLGHVAVALPLPEKYSDALNQLDQSEQRYQELRRNNKLIRQTYMQALLLITLLVLFGTTWSALALSKMVTRPVTALAEGTQAISAGKLDYRVRGERGRRTGTAGWLIQQHGRRTGEQSQPVAGGQRCGWKSAGCRWRRSWRAFPRACFRWMGRDR